MINELDSRQEARLFVTTLDEWTFEPQVITYGGILICRKGKARLKVNFKEWEMYEGAVITIFPNDVVLLTKDNGNDFEVEMLKYDANCLFSLARGPLQTGLSCRHQYHQPHVCPAQGVLRPSSMHLSYAVGAMSAESFLHRIQRIPATKSTISPR